MPLWVKYRFMIFESGLFWVQIVEMGVVNLLVLISDYEESLPAVHRAIRSMKDFRVEKTCFSLWRSM